VPLAPVGVTVRLLADKGYHKPSLAPATKNWIGQYGCRASARSATDARPALCTTALSLPTT